MNLLYVLILTKTLLKVTNQLLLPHPLTRLSAANAETPAHPQTPIHAHSELTQHTLKGAKQLVRKESNKQTQSKNQINSSDCKSDVFAFWNE